MSLASASYIRMERLTAMLVERSSHQNGQIKDPADWTERDLARMTPEAREDYERFILSDRPNYIPMKPEKLAKLSPEDRQEYENSLKITKTPRRYALRSRPY
jgi:hypothetical protein